jgi:prepilin-type N-terminal cleavage/methylation domain-containing protein
MIKPSIIRIGDKGKPTSISRRRAGLSLVEILIALAIAALLLLATAMAFDGAFKSYKANHDMAMSSMTARNSLYQICSTLRSAWNDPLFDIGGGATEDRGIYVNDDGTECSLIDSSGREVIYKYDTANQQLQVNLDNGAKWYVFINNVQPVTADMPIFAATELNLEGFNPGTISRVDINFRVLEDKTSRAVSAAVVPRNVVYAVVD